MEQLMVVKKLSARNYKDSQKKARVYVWLRGESVLDNLVNRRARPIAAFRKAAQKALPALVGNFRWSQKAGCGCGCSPGFILDSHHGCEWHVSVLPVAIDRNAVIPIFPR